VAGTYLPARVLDLCTASCNAVTGIQAYQGKKIWDETDSVENEVRGLTKEEQGRMWLWIKQRQSPSFPWQPFVVTVGAELLLRLPRDESSVMDKAYDLIELVCAKLENGTTFSSVPAVPKGLTWQNIEDESPEDDVMRVSIEVTYQAGPSCEV